MQSVYSTTAKVGTREPAIDAMGILTVGIVERATFGAGVWCYTCLSHHYGSNPGY